MLKTILLVAALTSASFGQKNAAMAPVTDIEGLPRVLLIGDSISIGYTVGVRKSLQGKANVHRPTTNCGPTTKGLKGIDTWLNTGGKDKKWDVIHFNWGLHDLKYMGPKGQNLADPKAKTSKPQVSPADYEKNLRKLVQRLKKTDARLIWRNTTPVPEGAKGRVVGDSAKYNDIAAKIMKEEGIEIHDLFSFAKKHAAKIQKKADVHYTPAGSKMLADEVVKALNIGEWTSPFNGKDFSGWSIKSGKATYKIEGDTIVGTTVEGSPNTFLVTDKQYGDFEIQFETKVHNSLNSGCQIRSQLKNVENDKYGGRLFGPQVESEASGENGAEAGYIYGEATGRGWLTPKDLLIPHKHFKDGEWNHFRIVAKGANIKTWINGELISDLSDEEIFKTHAKGHIGLQVHGIGKKQGPFTAAWKNIKLKEL
ncbi:DUF1080 domain-containing protein [Akkermansiaceae bacterium]|nr:DUF1080 domain-containing protein [Akkermansiaceae bacterium]MDB4323495.1 DUF1080 domain-containing protein [Akkermansiaceae bacterium]